MKDQKSKLISDKIGIFVSPVVMLLITKNAEQIKEAKKYILNKLSVDVGDLFEIEPDTESKKETIAIKQVRQMIHWIMLTPQKKHKIVFINKADQMTEEAANAMLKTLEEPPKYSIIVLFSPHVQVLPTIKSRSRLIFLEQNIDQDINHDEYIKTFLQSSFFRQSKSIEEIIKQGKTSQFLRSLEDWIRVKMLETNDIKYTTLAENILTTRKNLKANVNARLALENLALTISHSEKIKAGV